MTCVVFGLPSVPCRAAPDLTMHHAALYASRPVDGMSTIISEIITAAGWVMSSLQSISVRSGLSADLSSGSL
jgi:hypothetical protein